MKTMVKLKQASQYLATHIVHWPTGPTPCCKIHADGLVKLANMMGSYVGVTQNLDPTLQCQNCVNQNNK